MPDDERNKEALDAKAIKLQLKKATEFRVAFAFGLAPAGPEKCVFLASYKGRAQRLETLLKKGDKNREIRKFCFGEMTRDGNSFTLYCKKPIPNLQTMLNKHFRSLGLPTRDFEVVRGEPPA